MREVVLKVRCDACGTDIEEQREGESNVTITRDGVSYEIDICHDDFYGTFLQEARPTKQVREKTEVCHCGSAFATKRGLSRHKGIAHPEESS